MFWKMVEMDLRRCFHLKKVFFIIGAILALMFLTDAANWETAWRYRDYYNIVGMLQRILTMDEYKIIMAIALGVLHSGSVSSDDETKYMRLILARTNIKTYTYSRFLVNSVAIISGCIVSFLLFTLLLSPFWKLCDLNDTSMRYVYIEVLKFSPILYIIMMGLQFGIIVAACGAISLLFSTYQSNQFVSIGLVGMGLFVLLSYTPKNTIFNLMPLIIMGSFWQLSAFPLWVNYVWGISYPSLIIIICGCLFYRRMKWRMANGYI